MEYFEIMKRPQGTFIRRINDAEPDVLFQALEEMNVQLSSDDLLELIYNTGKEVLLPAAYDKPAKSGKASHSSKNLLMDISPDGMQVLITVPPALPGSWTVPGIKAHMAHAGISFGVDEKAIARACLQPGIPVLAASGKPVLKGMDAVITYLFSPPDKKPVVLADGSVDHYQLGQIVPIKAGETIALRTPPTPGSAGMTVRGEEVPALPGANKNFNTGKGVVVLDDKAIAEFDGSINWNGDKISVMKTYTIQGDVDFSVGNIDFPGKVLITGSVRDGFKVEADEDIDIRGGVDNAIISSRRGSIYIQKGVIGRGSTRLSAARNIEAKFIQEAIVQAGQNIVVNEYLMRCQAKAGDSVFIQGRRGRIMGNNSIQARTKIKAARIQNARELELRVEGFDRRPMVQQVKDLNRNIGLLEVQLKETTGLIRQLQESVTSTSITRLQDILPIYMKSLQELESLIDLRNSLVNILKTTRGEGMIEIGGGLEGGMLFTIKNEAVKVDAKADRINIYFDPELKRIIMF